MTEYKQIQLINLEIGGWYIGRGRRANIGLWNGSSFTILADCGVWAGSVKESCEKKPCIKYEKYYTSENGSFQPFLKVDFGITINKTEENGFGGGYGKKVKFK